MVLLWCFGVLGCGACLWGSLRQLRRRRLLDDTPSSKVLGVFIGMTELKGTVESSQPLTSVLAGRTCVLYHWQVEESWSRTVTETTTDSKGNTTTRTRTESGWTKIAGGGQQNPFYLQDETGVILVRPDGAQIDADIFFEETVGRDDPLYYSQGGTGSVAHSDHRRRFSEDGLPLHSPLYLIGPARERADVVAPEIAADKLAPMYLISTRTEEKVKSRISGFAWLWGVLGLIITSIPGAVLLSANADGLPGFWPKVLVAPMLYLGTWGLGWVWMVYNSMIGLRQRVRAAWSLIDVQLQRRHTLIPQIVTVVTALSCHEQEVQTALARLRTQLTATAPGVAGPDFAGVAATVRVIGENYPQLTAQTGFTRLQQELVETEQRIALARAYYNDIATELATRLQIVPDGWVVRLRRMQPEPLLQSEDFERATVLVTLV